MSLRTIDFSKLSSPIGRFRDMVKNTLGTEPAAMVTGWYQSLGRRQAETRERTRRAVTRPDQWAVERDRLRADYQAALFAALVYPRIRKLTLERCLTSFGELIEIGRAHV